MPIISYVNEGARLVRRVGITSPGRRRADISSSNPSDREAARTRSSRTKRLMVSGALAVGMLIGLGVAAPGAVAGGPPTGVGPTVRNAGTAAVASQSTPAGTLILSSRTFTSVGVAVRRQGASQGQPVMTVRFPTFAATATNLTLLPNRVQFAAPNSSAVSQLATLESTGRVTPKVVITLGSGSTLTLRQVMVTSVGTVTGSGATSFEIALGFLSVLPS
jgi:hypothetical protein